VKFIKKAARGGFVPEDLIILISGRVGAVKTSLSRDLRG
jgi:tRNA A37 threonylcarbamoyladenosine biosynthesis protein TsaE